MIRAAPVARLERRIALQLLAWAGVSAAAGAALLFGTPREQGLGFEHGLGLQFSIWGLIDAGVGAFGLWRAGRPQAAGEASARRAARLRRALLINAALDVLYLAGGAAILIFLRGPFTLGNGWGVIIQGGFLLLFDGLHALNPALRRAA